MKLPDGREIFVPQGDPWPVIDEMPSVEEVQEVPPFGAPMTLANHSAAIDEFAESRATVTTPGFRVCLDG